MRERSKIQEMDMKHFRSIEGKPRWDRITNEILRGVGREMITMILQFEKNG
jgi:hypothetical protein